MATIDFEEKLFFDRIAGLRFAIKDYEDWCNTYKSFNYPKWTMRDGNKIKLSDMSTEHLENTISLVKRKDPSNGWVKILEQEKMYREFSTKLKEAKKELVELEKVAELIYF